MDSWWVDDFWGPEQWEVFRETMARVLPRESITDLTESGAVMHVRERGSIALGLWQINALVPNGINAGVDQDAVQRRTGADAAEVGDEEAGSEMG